MRFIVIGNQEGLDILRKDGHETIDWQLHDTFYTADADAYFYLKEEATALRAFIENEQLPGKPVFINSPIVTLKEMSAPGNVCRINGWPTFLERTSWELVGNVTNEVEIIFKQLDKIFISVPDEPGMIAARVISMVINEGYFALEESVSTKAEIDTAMKLGTNYPYGPFEWANKIGVKNISDLLNKMAETDARYLPNSLLMKEALEQ